jgi:hypothetical protein
MSRGQTDDAIRCAAKGLARPSVRNTKAIAPPKRARGAKRELTRNANAGSRRRVGAAADVFVVVERADGRVAVVVDVRKELVELEIGKVRKDSEVTGFSMTVRAE